MRHYISAVLAATLFAGLTACGTGGSSTTPSESTSASTKPPNVVPNDAGKPYPDANKAFSSAGFRTTLAIGPDGKQWETLTPGNDILAASSPSLT